MNLLAIVIIIIIIVLLYGFLNSKTEPYQSVTPGGGGGLRSSGPSASPPLLQDGTYTANTDPIDNQPSTLTVQGGRVKGTIYFKSGGAQDVYPPIQIPIDLPLPLQTTSVNIQAGNHIDCGQSIPPVFSSDLHFLPNNLFLERNNVCDTRLLNYILLLVPN